MKKLGEAFSSWRWMSRVYLSLLRRCLFTIRLKNFIKNRIEQIWKNSWKSQSLDLVDESFITISNKNYEKIGKKLWFLGICVTWNFTRRWNKSTCEFLWLCVYTLYSSSEKEGFFLLDFGRLDVEGVTELKIWTVFASIVKIRHDPFFL